MAHLKQRREQNIDGDFYVDASCIDCDTCRWMAPHTFLRSEGQSAVYHQPQSETERYAALQALLSCPTASIGTVNPPTDIKAVQHTFPIAITDGVYHCGYASEKSFAAASYFIHRPDGNILVDSPRFTKPLVQELEKLGGVKYLYLTHRDDIADHQQYQAHFGCDRLLHIDDITRETQEVEHPLQGQDPYPLGDDCLIIPVPGHTKGHTVLLFQNQVLLTGDHLAWSEQRQGLFAFKDFCWYSWDLQIQSMKRLLEYSFEWVLPGHGRRYHTDPDQMRADLKRCIDWMQR